MPPRALAPSGVILVDKPAGPTSFAVVAATRRRTGARTGHAGTLDPFATGLLLLLSGAPTRLQPQFVGLPKRYETTVDLAAPGVDIASLAPNGGYVYMSGTSMATPHVSGAAALAFSYAPTATAAPSAEPATTSVG